MAHSFLISLRLLSSVITTPFKSIIWLPFWLDNKIIDSFFAASYSPSIMELTENKSAPSLLYGKLFIFIACKLLGWFCFLSLLKKWNVTFKYNYYIAWKILWGIYNCKEQRELKFSMREIIRISEFFFLNPSDKKVSGCVMLWTFPLRPVCHLEAGSPKQ